MFVEFKLSLHENTVYIEPDSVSFVRPLNDGETLVGIKGMPHELQLKETTEDVLKRLGEA